MIWKRATNDKAESVMGGVTGSMQAYIRCMHLSIAAAVCIMKQSEFFQQLLTAKTQNREKDYFTY